MFFESGARARAVDTTSSGEGNEWLSAVKIAESSKSTFNSCDSIDGFNWRAAAAARRASSFFHCRINAYG